MKLISSIKNQTASILAITALAVGFTPVLPALADNLSDITGPNVSDITGPNVSGNTVLRTVDSNGNTTALVGNPQQVQAAQQLVQELGSCAASGCGDLSSLINQAVQLIQELQASQVVD
ncbi:MAG: hypothetical protein F6K56_29690 [Moorea sp. SIO3G5]|nr:hypothetical protein [Moorena sp. SIO3G5]